MPPAAMRARKTERVDMSCHNDLPHITFAEVLLAVLLIPAALIVIAGYFLDRVGLPIDPLAPLVALSGLLAFALALWRQGSRAVLPDRAGLLGLAVTVGLAALYCAKASGRSLLPATSATDLIDHLTLIDYIQRHNHLVHNVAAAKPYLQYMTTYPAGSHILGAVAATWLRMSNFRAIQPITIGCILLEIGFLYYVILRLLPHGRRHAAFAVVGCGLLLLPWGRFHQWWQGDYLAQSFLGHEFFYAQIVAQLFVVASLWALVFWNEVQSSIALAFFALCAAAVVLAWPGLAPVPVTAFAALLLTRRDMTVQSRLRVLLLGDLPAILVGLFYLLFYYSPDHVYLTHEGDMPTLYSTLTNWLFAALLVVGCLSILRSRRARPLLIAFLVAAAQYAVMLALAHHGVMARYVAHKMLYLLAYLGTAIAALGLAEIWPIASGGWRTLRRGNWAVLGAALPVLFLIPGIQRLPWPPPRPYSVDLYRVGVWTRENLPPQCIDYVTRIWQAEYWLHLAVLGNRRDTARTNAMYASFQAPAEVRWHPAQLQPYVIVEGIHAVTPDITAGARPLFIAGEDAIFQRPGTIPCTEQPVREP